MNTKMYVGNLSYDTTQNDLTVLFEQYGTVRETHFPMDRDTGRPRGFAFITMGNAEEMNAAIGALHGRDFQGRDLTVNEARPKTENSGGGYGAKSYGGGRNGGYDRGNRY